MLIIIMMAQTASIMPTPCRKPDQGVRAAVPRPNAPNKAAAHKAKTTQPETAIVPDIRGETIHQAVANNKTPKAVLTLSIQAPALGNTLPEPAPTISSKTPDPQAKANRAEPPRTTSPVCEINSSTPAKGAATQGPTISADSMPIRNTPPICPPGKRFMVSFKRFCSAAGACTVKTSSMDKASTTRIRANRPKTHGFCNQLAKPAPSKPAATPSKV